MSAEVGAGPDVSEAPFEDCRAAMYRLEYYTSESARLLASRRMTYGRYRFHDRTLAPQFDYQIACLARQEE